MEIPSGYMALAGFNSFSDASLYITNNIDMLRGCLIMNDDRYWHILVPKIKIVKSYTLTEKELSLFYMYVRNRHADLPFEVIWDEFGHFLVSQA